MNIKELVGKTLTEVIGSEGDNYITFKTVDGKTYRLFHEQDCCESVSVEDVCGDMQDLIGSPVIQAEESSNSENPEGVTVEDQDSFLWTFYRISTAKGQVVIRWYGESNGCYSESVDFEEVE